MCSYYQAVNVLENIPGFGAGVGTCGDCTGICSGCAIAAKGIAPF